MEALYSFYVSQPLMNNITEKKKNVNKGDQNTMGLAG